ncbi:hypothetical protein QTP88_015156 [Uroleucon formosanum]
MTVCQFCSALNWRYERKGLCCSNDFFIADTDPQVSTRCNIYSREPLRLHINEIDTSNVTWIQSFQTAIENVPSNVPDYKGLIRAGKV